MREHGSETAEKVTETPVRTPLESPAAARMLSLQRTAGNAAVGRLLARADAPAAAPPGDGRVREVLQHLREGRWDVDSLAAKLSDAELTLLRSADRVAVIADIGGGNRVDTEDETTIIRLLDTTPAADRPAVRAGLLANGSAILRTLEGAIQRAEYEKYHKALRRLLLDVAGPEGLLKAEILPWSDPGPGHSLVQGKVLYDEPTWTADGRLRVGYRIGHPAGPLRVAEPMVLAPDQIVGIHFLSSDPEAGAKAGEKLYVPAINILLLYNRQSWRDFRFALDIGLALAGTTGVLATTSTVLRIMEAVSAVVGLVGVGLEEYRRDIARTPDGVEFLKLWDALRAIVAVYSLTRLATPAVTFAFRRARDLYRTVRASLAGEKAAQIERQMEDIGRQVEEAERQLAGKPPTEGAAPPEKSPPAGTAAAPEGSPAALLRRFRSVEEVASWVETRLSQLDHSLEPKQLDYRLGEALAELAKFSTPVNQRLGKLVPAVNEALRNPKLYARVLAQAWQRATATGTDINAALMAMAAEGGVPSVVVTEFLDDAVFFERYATLAARIIDKGAGPVHGLYTHVLQDLVVDLGLREAGFAETAIQFRGLLRQAEGRDLAGVRAGDLAWRGTYDAQRGLNTPEQLCPALAPLGFQ